MRLSGKPIPLAILIFLFVVLPLGMLEGWYGRMDYSGDAIPYLDMARAVHDGQWKLAFNPLWGLGYPLLIAFVKPLFETTAYGEWNAVHLLNLFIFISTYASFLFLLHGISRSFALASSTDADKQSDWKIAVSGVALFVGFELCLDNVSRVGPDLLVTGLILLALGLLLQLLGKPAISTALVLGATLGFGYVVKTIFLPVSLVIVLVALFALYRRRRQPLLLAFTIIVAALFAGPYVAGLSWSMGRLTLGEAGTINYAWHVNRLSLMHWQGGPAQFGKPLHPTTQLLADPPIYSFAEPFHVSYPPFFNPPYYYEGYRHFFNVKLQARAIAANCLHLVQALRRLPIVYAIVLALLVIYFSSKDRRDWLQSNLRLWTIFLPALAAVALYIQVHLEGRYLPAFLLVMATVPVTLFFLRSEQWPAYVSSLVLALFIFGSLATFGLVNRGVFADARSHLRYRDTGAWVLARFLTAHGLQPDDPVAFVGGPATHCTWAYVDRLRIVAELSPDLYDPPGTAQKMFWAAPPAQREQMLQLFALAGAKIVIAPASQKPMTGWIVVPGTDIVVRDLVPGG